MDNEKDEFNFTLEHWRKFDEQIEEHAEEVKGRNAKFELKLRTKAETRKYFISTTFKEVDRLKEEIISQFEMLALSLEALDDFYRERSEC